MKLLICSDFHIHNYRAFDKDGSRLENGVEVIRHTFQTAREHGCNYVLFTGDLTDQANTVPIKVTLSIIQTFKECFEEYPEINWLAISGNHDLGAKSTLANYRELPSMVQVLSEIFGHRFQCMDGIHFKQLSPKVAVSGIPYLEYKEDYAKVLKAVACGYSPCHILLIHQTPLVPNNKFPADTDPSDPLYQNFNHVFCGHIHKYAKLTPNFTVVGQPAQQSTDDGDQRTKNGVIIYDTDTGEQTYIDYHFPKFVSVQEGEDLTKYVDAGHYITVLPKVVSQAQSLDIELTPTTTREEVLTAYWEQEGDGNDETLAVGLKILENIL